MRSILRNIVILSCLSVLLYSCDQVPQPIVVDPLELSFSVSKEVAINKVMFRSVLIGKVDYVTECGFLIQGPDGKEWNLSCDLEGKSFQSEYITIEYDTEYCYRAYVGNGQNLIYSQTDSLNVHQTPCLSLHMLSCSISCDGEVFELPVYSRYPYTVTIPDDAPWLTFIKTDDGCVFTAEANLSDEQRSTRVLLESSDNRCRSTFCVIQPGQPDPETRFVVHETDLEYPAYDQCINIKISGGDDYEVIIPEEAKEWISCVGTAKTLCSLYLRWNTSTERRSFDLIFKSLNRDLTRVLHITQNILRNHTIDFNYEASEYVFTPEFEIDEGIYHFYEVDDYGEGVYNTWYMISKDKKEKNLYIQLEENSSDSLRVAKILVLTHLSESDPTVSDAMLLFIRQQCK